MSRLNKDFEQVCEFYVSLFMDTITKEHTHVDKNELWSIWKDILRPPRTTIKPHKQKKTVSTPSSMDLKYEKQKRHLETMRYDDLYRHCARHGLQPPPNKEDMIRVILTRVCPSS